MNPNHWMLLMGVTPKFGHMPLIYSLGLEAEIIKKYEAFLAPQLNLTGEIPTYKPTELEQLRQQNADLRDQILKLTHILTQKLV
jgi:hypothetical protein